MAGVLGNGDWGAREEESGKGEELMQIDYSLCRPASGGTFNSQFKQDCDSFICCLMPVG